MKATGISLAIALALTAGVASAQSHDDDRYGPAPYGSYERRAADDRPGEAYSPQGHYDWARVVRVDPVFDGRTRPVQDARRCETRRDAYVGRDRGGDYYRDDYYRDDSYGGRDDRYRDPYGDPYREARRDENGRMVATVLGGIAGAVLGSKIGDGSGRYVGTAVGSMVGGMAGRGIYDANRRARAIDDGYVTVCGPERYRTGGYGRDGDGPDPYERTVDEYDVTYEYAGRQYATRTRYHPGDRIRVRVDVRAE